MQWFFDKLEGFRSLILTFMAGGLVYFDFARDTLNVGVELFAMPVDSPGAIAAFLPAAVVAIKVVIDMWRKARGSASIV